MEWIRLNWPVVSFCIVMCYYLVALHVDHTKLRKESDDMKLKVEEAKKNFDAHWADSVRHIDPIRDTATQKAMVKRLDNIEDMLRELLTNQKRRRREGDSDDE